MSGVTNVPTVDRAVVKRLKDLEDARFLREHPRSAALRRRGLEVMPNGVPMAWHRSSDTTMSRHG